MEVEGGQIYLASNSKANGLNEAISSQVVHIVVLNKLILLSRNSIFEPGLLHFFIKNQKNLAF